jgi:tRNA pseudouridine55 synthase
MSRRRRRQGRNDEILQGVLLVDKPVGMTSREVCEFVRSRMRLGKVGHGGTLDPFATGLLPLLINGATRLMPYLQDQDKTYRATVQLGVRTDTMDPTGEVTATADASNVDEDRIREVVAGFLGEQKQTVPLYAAARVDGKRLYEYARDNEEVELPTKDVVIHSIELLAIRPGEGTTELDLDIHCGTGTYVRAIADDIGEALGVGGHLSVLHRLRNGGLCVDAALSLQAIGDQADAWRDERLAQQDEEDRKLPFLPEQNAKRWADFLGGALIPVALLLGGLATLRVTPEMVARVRSGQPIRRGDLERIDGDLPPFRSGDRLVLEDPNGLRGLALARATCSMESLGRREASAIVMAVERVLR